jgi:cytochrome c-type biogenesis protein
LAGILTVATPCSLPVLPALLGVSLGQRDKARPAFITMGLVAAFTAAAVFFSVTTQIAGVDPTALRTVAAALLAAFGALMLWPHPFQWFSIQIGARFVPGDRIVMRFAQGNLGAFASIPAISRRWKLTARASAAGRNADDAPEHRDSTIGVMSGL